MMRSSKRKIATAMPSSRSDKRKKTTGCDGDSLPDEMIMEVLLRGITRRSVAWRKGTAFPF
jgi:hypothetical protein